MKFYAEDESGKRYEFKEIETVDSAAEILLFFCTERLTAEAREQLGATLSRCTKRTCVLLDKSINRVMGV